jgi:tripartite-type tricarboxylate transporter receptor subunit TctC
MAAMKTLARVAAIALCALALSPSPSPAQSWPQRTVKFIVPLGPGSGADISARLFADRLSQRWGQSVVVENRPGADGVVAITAFIGAADDHTLLFGPSSSFVGHPYTLEKMSYDPRELSPIAKISNTVVSIAAPGAMNVGSLKALIDEVRAQPGKLNWATITGVTDIIVAGYAKNAGLEMNKIPYRDPVQALNDLAESRIHFYVAALAITRAQAQAGRIKLLAVTNHERAPSHPDLPTASEAGVPQLSFDGLVGLYGPRTMPAELRDRIAADLKEVASDPEISGRLTATGQLVRPGNAAEFAASIDAQAKQLAEFARTLGIQAKSQ